MPLHEGSWEQRRFYTIDIQSQSTNDIIEKLTSFLSRQEVAEGKAVKNAENIYNSRQKGEIIRQALPKAWRKLLSESDDFLAESVVEAVEKICGYKPENVIVIDFLKEISGEISLISIPKQAKRTTSPYPISNSDAESRESTQSQPLAPVSTVDYKKPASFEFNGLHYEVKSWIILFKAFLQLMAETHPDKIHVLTMLVGKKRPYFTTDSSLLRKAEQIPNSTLFFETNLSSNDILKLIHKVIQSMGYERESIQIHLIE